MKTLQSFSITPVAAALILGGALLSVSGCKGHDADDTTDAANTPPAASTAAMPADTAMANGMASDTTPMSSSTAGAPMPADGAMAGGPVDAAQFYTEAMQGDQKEISVSDMVAKQSTNADVKALAKKISSDHAALDKQVKAAAGSSVTPPAADTSMLDSMKGKTGADLDKAYVDAMVSDHQTDIPKFENVAQNGSTPEAKKLASDALPKLRDHLKMSQDLQQKMASK